MLYLSPYQATGNLNPIKYREARFINGIPVYYTKYNQLESKSLGAPRSSKTHVLLRQSGAAGNLPAGATCDSLKGQSYSRIDYDYHISGQIASATVFTSGTAGTNALRRTEYEWDGLASIT